MLLLHLHRRHLSRQSLKRQPLVLHLHKDGVPSRKSPRKMGLAIAVSSSYQMARFKGRAPYTGSSLN